ncbi:hypothetical protein AAFP35_16650 [Gordonia sp. CPCC 206044]|uniref:hypothetical protein n=1 Tax=Gordonia sp. CPCC 206044 TaxID=3140793 RepID=UPI003AF4006A
MTTELDTVLPLYEGKMGNIYDHRSASFVGIGDTDIAPNHNHSSSAVVLPRYWISPGLTEQRHERRSWGTQSAMLGFRRVARNTDERTCIAAVLPWGASSYGWILSAGPSAESLAFLCAQYNSFCFDYTLRQFLTQPSVPQGTFEQLPTVTRQAAEDLDLGIGGTFAWVVAQCVRLSATDEKLATWAAECGCADAPYEWDLSRRITIRAELDAAFFHLYGIERDDVDYIMDTFPIVKRKDEADFGEYRTKRLILEAFDRMASC